MGRAPLLALAAAAALAASLAFASPPRFAAGAVKLGGDPKHRAVREHARWARQVGFDALFAYGVEVGRWWDDRHRRPRLSRAFRSLATACRRDGTRLLVSVDPPADSHGRFVFSEERGLAALARFAQLLHAVGVSDLVLSFDDQPRTLDNVRDVLRYGPGAAPAHLDLAARLSARLPPGMHLWLCAAAYADVHLADGSGPYSRAFLERLPALPAEIGIVWTGPDVISPAITRDDLRKTRARLGGRRLLLYDNFPTNDSAWLDTLAVALGPLRGRAPDLAAEADVYLACPLAELGASRLALSTTADWLRDPVAYDPETSWGRAIDTLAGPAPAARQALAAQAREWGASPGDPGYPFRVSPQSAARGFGDPAARARWRQVVETYPARLEALAEAEDEEFSWWLSDVMRRTLAVARAWLAIDAGDHAAVKTLWEESRGTPARALYGFFEAAGVSP